MTDTTSPSITSPNVQLVRDAYAAFATGDIESVVASMHPQIEWHEAEHSPWHAPSGHRGPSEVLTQVFARIPESFDRFEVDAHAFHDAGQTVIVEGRYRATAAGSDEHLDSQVCHVWTVRDGLLARFQQYTDTWELSRVTGRSNA